MTQDAVETSAKAPLSETSLTKALDDEYFKSGPAVREMARKIFKLRHRAYIAIDPGSSSGAVAIWDYETKTMTTANMPETMVDIWRLLSANSGYIFVAGTVEKVGGTRPGNSAKSAHTFAEHCGALKMAFLAAGIKLVGEPIPQVWLRALFQGRHPKGMASCEVKARKDFIYNEMQKQWPTVPFTKRQADAVALLTWSKDLIEKEKP